MEKRTVRDDGSGRGNENTAAYVANEVDDSRDLVARFFWKSDISRSGNGDKREGNREHLKNSQPGCKTEGHVERKVRRSVIKREGEAGEAECSHISRWQLTGSNTGYRHHDEEHKSSSCERLSGTGCR